MIEFLRFMVNSVQDFSPLSESERLSEIMQEVSTTEDSIRSRSSSPYWKNDSDDTCGSPSSSSLQSSPTIEEQNIMEKQAGLLCEGNHP